MTPPRLSAPSPTSATRPSSTRIEAMTLPELATTFVEATVRKLGTDEDKLFAVIKEVRLRGKSTQSEFTETVSLKLSGSERKRLLSKGNGNLIHGILRNEFSPLFSRAELGKAERIWDGKEIHSTSRGDHLLAGMTDGLDLSSTGAKAGFLGTAAISILCPVAGLVIAGGFLLYGGYKVGTGISRASKATTEEEVKHSYRGIGQGLTMAGGGLIGLRGARGSISSQASTQVTSSVTPKTALNAEPVFVSPKMTVADQSGKIQVIDFTSPKPPLPSSPSGFLAKSQGPSRPAVGEGGLVKVLATEGEKTTWIFQSNRPSIKVEANPRDWIVYDRRPTARPLPSEPPQGFSGFSPTTMVEPQPDLNQVMVLPGASKKEDTIGDPEKNQPTIGDLPSEEALWLSSKKRSRKK